mmetsp:Transcript_61088/g.177062  ORF Transcript_61088/g.177062 Transcript_61088/m.177062 type:complete len:101 (+) Transcript_61088:64-366(+)
MLRATRPIAAAAASLVGRTGPSQLPSFARVLLRAECLGHHRAALGVPEAASNADIERAYRLAVLQSLPENEFDDGAAEEAAIALHRAASAYAALAGSRGE